MKPRLTLIAAADQGGLLANARGIPWNLPDDVKQFRAYTRGKWLLAGRRTYEEMLGWFDEGHKPLVLTSDFSFKSGNRAQAVTSVPAALELAEKTGADELVCVGGARTYEAALPFADTIILTTVQHRFAPDEGAVRFPAFERRQWRVEPVRHHPEDREHSWPFDIEIWRRLHA